MNKIRGKNPHDDVLDERFGTLYEILKQRKVSALADFASSDGFSSLLAASRVAPVQVYYSMAYHYMEGPGWDAYFCVGCQGETSRTYDGRSWRAVTLSYQEPRAVPDASKLEDAGRSIKAKRFPMQSVVLGAIARPQKLDSDEFLATLASILKKTAMLFSSGLEQMNQKRCGKK